MASDAVVNLVVNAAGADSRIAAQLRLIADDAERNAPDITLQVRVDDQGRLRDARGRFVAMQGDVDRTNRGVLGLSDSVGDLSNHLFSAAKGIGQLALKGAALSQLVPVAAGLVTSITNIAPAAATGVAAFVTMQAASATLKLGLTGVSDALGAVFDPDADPEKVAEALKNLSTNAQAFVKQVQQLKPEFDKLRLDVQDRLFRDLDKTLVSTAKATLPTLRNAAREFADTFNAMGRDVGTQARQLAKEGTLGKALDGGAAAFENLRDIPGQVLLAIGRLSAGGAPLLERVTDRIADLADGLTDKLAKASASGALEDAVNAAGDAIAQLGRIGANVFETLGNILGLATTQGDGLFGTLEKVTAALADVTDDAPFVDILTTLISLGGTLVDTILPLLEEALAAIAPAVSDLGPVLEDLVKLLGDQLAQIIPELAPLLQQLVINFGLLVEAAAPLVPPLVEIAITLLPLFMQLLQELVPVIEDTVPVIQFIADVLTNYVIPALKLTVDAAVFFVDQFSTSVDMVKDMAEDLGSFVSRVFREVIKPAIDTVSALLRGDWSSAWESARSTVEGAAGAALAAVDRATGGMGTDIRNFLSGTLSSWRSSFDQLVSATRSRLSDASNLIGSLPGRARSALGDLGSVLYNAGRSLISGFISGIRSQLSAVASAASDIVGTARDFFPFSPAKRGPFSGRGYTRFSGQKLITDFAQGIQDRRGVVARELMNAMNNPLIGPARPIATSDPATHPVALGQLAAAGFTRSSTSVQLFIGNEEFRGYMRAIVNGELDDFNRQASQGVRS